MASAAAMAASTASKVRKHIGVAGCAVVGPIHRRRNHHDAGYISHAG